MSLRRTTLFTANIARMASVTSRIRWSLIVIHDNSARTAYAASAMARRFTRNRFTRQRSCENPAFENPGAQGRIRTSVPRKEEQIYSLPALTTHPPVQKRRAFRLFPSASGKRRRDLRVCAEDHAWQPTLPKTEEQYSRTNILMRAEHHTWKSSLMECCWKIRCAAAAPRKCPAFRNRSPLINAGAGEGI